MYCLSTIGGPDPLDIDPFAFALETLHRFMGVIAIGDNRNDDVRYTEVRKSNEYSRHGWEENMYEVIENIFARVSAFCVQTRRFFRGDN